MIGCDDECVTGMSGDVAQLVENYLGLCEARELEAASALLAADATIVFPGGTRYRSLDEMVADAATRYHAVRKRRQIPLVATCEDGSALVLSRGTLEGEAFDGRPFSGIRYVDVFLVRDGRIHEQHVFNDLADHGVVQPR